MNGIKNMLEKLNKGQSSRVIIYMASRMILQGITVVSMPLFTRLLTTEQYGRASVYSTWSTILALFIGLQIDSLVGASKVHYGEENFSKFCSNVYFIVMGIGLFFLLLASVFIRELSSLLHVTPILVLFLVLYSFGTACTKIQSCIFMVQKQAIKDIALSIALSLSALLVSVALILCMEEYEGEARMLGMGLPHVILGSIFCIFCLRNIKKHVDKKMIRSIVMLSIPLVFSGLSNTVLGQSDRVMLSEMIGDDQAGIYSFCYLVATPLTTIWMTLGHAWLPDYYENLSKGNETWLKEHSDNYMFLYTCLTCGYLLVGSEVLKLLGSKDYWSGISTLPLLSLGCYFQYIYNFPMYYETYCKKTKSIGIASTVTALINIGLNFWLIPICGMMGAAIATLTSYLILFLIHDIVARHLKGYHYKWGFYLKGLIPTLICFGITYTFADYIWIRWGLGICIGILLVRRVLKKRTLL